MNRFWNKVNKNKDCWEWVGAKTSKGYGVFWYNKKLQYSHRVSWELTYNEIPKGLFILHKCDNPSCVNPLHLFLGTLSDNMKDCVKKGRYTGYNKRGENNPVNRFNLQQIKDIRDDNRLQKIIAKEYKTDQPYISRIKK